MERPRYLAEAIEAKSGKFCDWHAHDFGQLISASRGSMLVGTPGRVLLLSPAMAIWVPPGIDHWMRYGSDSAMLYVDLNRTESGVIGAECRVMAMAPLLGALMVATLPEIQVPRSADHTTVLHDLLRRELQAARDVPLTLALPRDARILPLARAALDNPGSILSVEDWLGTAPASRKTVERLFIAETGMPPSRWLRHARILHAISRLAAGEKIMTVALDMGYASPSAFSYMFRQAIGVSPTAFARV